MIRKKIDQHFSGELVYGVHPILELLKAKKRKLLALYRTDPAPKAWRQIEASMHGRKVPVHVVSKEQLNRMAGCTDHQSIVALAAPFVVRKKMFDVTQSPFLVMLDGIQDARNVGAILRTASCLGVDGVILVKARGCTINSAVLKASAGLAEHLEILYVPSAPEAATMLKTAGYQLYLATFNGENAVKQTYMFPLCVVIGNEGEGISAGLVRFGTPITLPQRSADISYNASVAAGILLFLVAQQRL